MTPQGWLTTGEAGRRLGMSAGDVTGLIMDGELPGRPAPDYSRLIVREADVDRYLALHPQGAST
jgi:hypothetical protein